MGPKKSIAEDDRRRRHLGAIFFADVVGYSFLMGKDEQATLAATRSLIREFQDRIGQYDGRVIDVMGDGLLAFFDSVVNSVEFAVLMQKVVAKRNETVLGEFPVQFRIGINIGDVIAEEASIYGNGVNIASRIQGLAAPGGISISGAVYEQIRNKLNYGYECLGTKSLKNIADPVEVFRLRPERQGAIMLASARRLILGGASDHNLPNRPSVAVLPFANLSGDASEEFFSDGISEDIITSLSRFHDLFVIARNSSFTFKHKSLPAQEIGRALGVRYLVQGSVRRSGERLRIGAQLVESTRGQTLWAERFDRKLHDLFDLQDEITATIVTAMAVQIEAAEHERVRQSIPADMDAYGLVLRGQKKLFNYTRKDNAQARELYTAALELDPQYARAYAAISRTHNFDWRYSWSDDPDASLNMALELARLAVSLDESDARGYSELGFVNLYRKKHSASIDAYRRALMLNPNDADVMVEMADALVHTGEPDEAMVLIEKAMRLNPFYPDLYLWNLGGAYFNLRRYEEAVETLERMHNPTEGRRLLAASYAYLGRLDDARFNAAKLLEAHPEFSLRHWEMVQPDKDPEDTAHFVNGLKRAGLE